MKRTIIFFSRMGLVHLYGPLHQRFKDKYNVIHVAYSKSEAKLLKELFSIEVDRVFLDEVETLMNKEGIDPCLLKKIDHEYLLWTNNKFNLNSALISDRGFMYLDYSESLHLAQSYYLFWSEVIASTKKCILFHETTSLLFNHLCSMVCSRCGGVYTGFIEARGKHTCDFIFLESDDGRSLALKDNYLSITPLNEGSISEARQFIEVFKNKAKNSCYTKKSSLTHDLLYTFGYMVKKIHSVLFESKYDRVIENIDYYMHQNLSSIKYLNRLIYRFGIIYDQYNENDCFMFYPMHIEPEAVVQYWSGGTYTNQINLIEQIARNLPPNCFLYVKDHIHEFGYRDIKDYKKIKEIPNVKLLDPGVSGLFLANKSKGLVTVNGTMGLECIALGKPVYLLSSVYYDCFKGIIKLNRLEDLRDCLNKSFQCSKSDTERFISAYIGATFTGDVEAFFTKKIVSLDANQLSIYTVAFDEYISQTYPDEDIQ